MQIDNFIWSGCSFSAGSGFANTNQIINLKTGKIEEKPTWHHPDLEKLFTEGVNREQLKKEIHDITFPVLVGNMLKCKNIKNLAIAGMGHSIHIRNIQSYILNNKNNIDLSKTLVGLQLTSFHRVELINATKIDDEYTDYMNGNSNLTDRRNLFKFIWNSGYNCEDIAKPFSTTHFDFDFYTAKALVDILFFKGWCESLGIRCLLFGFNGFYEKSAKYVKDESVVRNSINYMELQHHHIQLPTIDTYLKELDVIEIPFIEGGTFVTEGYHDDSHYTINGHRKIANEIYSIILNKLNENNSI